VCHDDGGDHVSNRRRGTVGRTHAWLRTS
jgi:hypothetical protein